MDTSTEGTEMESQHGAGIPPGGIPYAQTGPDGENTHCAFTTNQILTFVSLVLSFNNHS